MISTNPMKPHPFVYTIGPENGTAAAYLAFIESLIENGHLQKGEFLISDNAAIHTGAEAKIIEDLLWSYPISDTEQLNVAVIYLPTRAPELNPIELVWRSLTMKIRATRVSSKTHAAADAAAQILSEMTHRSIRATYRECKCIK